MNHFRHLAVAAVGGAMLTAVCAFSAPAFAAGPEIVAGPASDPACFVPWSDKTKFFKFPAKKGPYRIALANGFVAKHGNVLQDEVTRTQSQCGLPMFGEKVAE